MWAFFLLSFDRLSLCSSVWIECFPPKEEVMRSNRITGIKNAPFRGAFFYTCDLEENATFDHLPGRVKRASSLAHFRAQRWKFNRRLNLIASH